MIKELKMKIFLIIIISLTAVVIGTTILFVFLNYRNTINTAVSVLDRLDSEVITNNFQKTPYGENIAQEINGIYYVLIQNSKMFVLSNSSYDKQIGEYALRINNNEKENGIIDKYIYKLIKVNENTSIIILMEDGNIIAQIRKIIYWAILFFVLFEIMVYIIAKKLSNVIVKPVYEGFEKQKQFISDASHELKTPLAVIEANADVLVAKEGNNKWILYIQNEIESMDKLINELLLLAQIEKMDVSNVSEQINLSNEAQIVTSMFESLAYENGITINTDIEQNVLIQIGKEDIKQILSTLIDNAIKHADFEKEIIVELKKEKNQIYLRVKNTGVPIPEEESTKIFERFYRIDKSRNRAEKRYGLGLAIAKSIVQKYNGQIITYRKDNFTVFEVNIPN